MMHGNTKAHTRVGWRGLSLVGMILLWGVSASAQGLGAAEIEIIPPHPTPQDIISIRLFSEWSNSCVPGSPRVAISGQEIRIDTFSFGGICLMVITPWELTVAIGQLPAGTYRVLVINTVKTLGLPIPAEVIGEAVFTVSESGCTTCQIQSGLVVRTARAVPDSPLTSLVEIRDAPNAVDALGFEVLFDPEVLQFTGFTPGPLTEAWDFFEAAEHNPGYILVGGFAPHDPISAGASGSVVELHFAVIACAAQQGFPVTLERLVDDVASWDTCAGCVTCRVCLPDGDVNQDGSITPGDALCVFQKFLGLPSCLD
jgi:hypothetical protein